MNKFEIYAIMIIVGLLIMPIAAWLDEKTLTKFILSNNTYFFVFGNMAFFVQEF